MRIALPLLALLSFAGCVGPAADVTANGLVLGGPTDAAFADFAAPFEAGIVLARPDNLIDLEANLVDDAERVWLQVDDAAIELPAASAGVYAVPDNAAVAYPSGRVITLHAITDGQEGIATLDAPAAPSFTLPEAGTHAAGTPLTIDLSSQGFDRVYAIVLDSSGAVLHDDRPRDAEAAIRDLRGADTVFEYTLPGSALANPGQAHALALVGIRRARAADLDGFEAFWSTVGAGATATGVVIPGS